MADDNNSRRHRRRSSSTNSASTNSASTNSASTNSTSNSNKMADWVPARLRKQYVDGAVAVLLVVATQAVILGLTSAGDRMNNFSAAILGMAALAITIIALDGGFRVLSSNPEAVQDFYQKHLAAPSNLLNRHMAIGFTVPFVHIFKATAASPREIGLITAMFLLCGIIFPVVVFGMTYALQSALIFARRPARPSRRPAGLVDPPAESGDRKNRRLSNQSTLIGQRTPRDAATDADEFQDVALDDDDDDRNQAPPPPTTYAPAPDSPQRHPHAARLMDWVLSNITLYACVLSVPIAVVIASCTDATVPLDVSVLFTAWLASHALQRWVSQGSLAMRRHPRVRTAVAVCLLNPVLVTAGATVAYIHARWALRVSKGQPETQLVDVVRGFQSGTTVARYAMRHILGGGGVGDEDAGGEAGHRRGRPHVGAGDLATSILESGLAAWGFKLFECRRQLASPTGLVVLAASAAAAAVTVVSAPLLAHAGAGLASAQSLSFATRSVTLALGTPVLTRLGGDVGANAAMVVFNGVVFQVVMGLGLGRWAAARLGAVRDRCAEMWESSRRRAAGASDAKSDDHKGHGHPDLELGDMRHDREAVADLARQLSRQLSSPQPQQQQQQQTHPLRPRLDVPPGFPNPPSRNRHAHMSVDSPPPTPITSSATQTPAAPSILVSPPASPNAASSGHDHAVQQQQEPQTTSDNSTAGATTEDARTVATGVTVGINAAAMGTSYLYESQSRAAPYSTLAMTLFGVMTVVFLSVSPLAEWLMWMLEH
ncbi:hypothetical protein RB597_007563 [Gaeumannomyces tritici]